jgi:hypothetical protein
MTSKIVCANALDWMLREENMGACGAVITSPPDMHEMPGASFGDWHELFTLAVLRSVRIHTEGCPIIFYVTDRKHEGKLISKANLIMDTMQICNGRMKLLWHKIALRRDVGKTDLMRPTFSHILAFGSNKMGPGKGTPDVIHRGRTLYPNGTGINAARVAVEFALQSSEIITDPFCGVGTIPMVAMKLGAKDAHAVDIDVAQCEKAKYHVDNRDLFSLTDN